MSSLLIGAFCAIGAAALWGSNYAVVKNYDMKDGMHFQFLLCLGVFFVGMLCMLVSSPIADKLPGEKHAPFLPDLKVEISLQAALIGSSWCLGNCLTVPILRRVGLGMGFSIWSGTALLTSYMIGRLALFGLEPEVMTHPFFGNIGLVFGVLSLLSFCQVDPEHSPKLKANPSEPLLDSLLDNENPVTSTANVASVGATTSQRRMRSRMSRDVPKNSTHEKYKGILFSLVAGLTYGVNFIPAQLHNQRLKRAYPDKDFDPTLESLRFFFSQYLGTFVCSALVFLGYNWKKKIKKKEIKMVKARAWIWSVLSGIMWAFGSLCAMLATAELGLTVGFPLASNGCFLVNNGWSYFHFKEITLPKNKRYFTVAVILNILSCCCLALSKS